MAAEARGAGMGGRAPGLESWSRLTAAGRTSRLGHHTGCERLQVIFLIYEEQFGARLLGCLLPGGYGWV